MIEAKFSNGESISNLVTVYFGVVFENETTWSEIKKKAYFWDTLEN